MLKFQLSRLQYLDIPFQNIDMDEIHMLNFLADLET